MNRRRRVRTYPFSSRRRPTFECQKERRNAPVRIGVSSISSPRRESYIAYKRIAVDPRLVARTRNETREITQIDVRDAKPVEFYYGSSKSIPSANCAFVLFHEISYPIRSELTVAQGRIFCDKIRDKILPRYRILSR